MKNILMYVSTYDMEDEDIKRIQNHLKGIDFIAENANLDVIIFKGKDIERVRSYGDLRIYEFSEIDFFNGCYVEVEGYEKISLDTNEVFEWFKTFLNDEDNTDSVFEGLKSGVDAYIENLYKYKAKKMIIEKLDRISNGLKDGTLDIRF